MLSAQSRGASAARERVDWGRRRTRPISKAILATPAECTNRRADSAPAPDTAYEQPASTKAALLIASLPAIGTLRRRPSSACAGRDPAGARADASVLGQLRGIAPSRRAARRDH